MILRNLLGLPASVLAFLIPHVLAQLPYNPSRILTAQNDTIAYVLAPQPSDTSHFTLSHLNISGSLTAAKPSLMTIDSSLPFLNGPSDAFIPLIDEDGSISVLSGNCNQGAHGAQLWRYATFNGSTNGSWEQLSLSSDDSTQGIDFLSAGLSFSPTATVTNAEIYTFGGMCPSPNTTTSASDWINDATYSNNMLTTSPEPSSSSSSTTYTLSISSSRGPPIPEAGLTITPLLPSTANSSNGVSQQQNFVLLGGHTQSAFINMSQVAVFSLPESSWSFMTVNSLASTSKTDLTGANDQANLEPRSGHTAVLTPDGSKIVVFGGWVGNINTAAQPQLAVLELGQGYGGTGYWSWTVPSLPNPFNSGQGVYGHGAAMLPGDVMMIMGGYSIPSSSSSKHKRAPMINSQALLFNTTSSSWISTYTNPNSPLSPDYIAPASAESGGSVHSTSKKTGLGVGLALGIGAVLGVLLIWFFYHRRLRQTRAMREKELRELALGAERFHSGSRLGGGVDGRDGTLYPDIRSASWGSRQERRLGTSSSTGDEDYPWAPVMDEKDAERLRVEHEPGDEGRRAERTGLLVETPSPTRGLRKSLYGRVQPAYGAATGMNGRAASVRGVPGSIHRIDEAEEEGSLPGSLRRKNSASLGALDKHGKTGPFMDPSLQPRPLSPGSIAKRKREREVAGWKDDWSAAAAAIDNGHLSRNTSKAESNWRTHSNLSEDSHSPTHSGGMHSSGRGSPDKSDRTGSNLSERSAMSGISIQRSVVGTVSRTASIRSASAGYALFAGAAAAMASRVIGSSNTAGLTRTPSKRAASLNTNSKSSSVKTGKMRDRSDTFSTARTSLGPAHPGERDALLGPLNAKLDHDDYATPPESPVKERAVPVMRQRDGSIRQAVGHIIGSARRVLTGTGAVAVSNRVAEFENRSEQNSPTKDEPEMTETHGRSVVSASILRGARGREDWGLEPSPKPASEVRVIKRKPLPGQSAQLVHPVTYNSDDDEWDVEAAVEQRVVQVMFTVPREKLRVVNADALSIMSKSSVDFEGGENDGGGEDKENKPDPKRVSTVVEEPPELEEEHGEVEGKGKGRAL